MVDGIVGHPGAKERDLLGHASGVLLLAGSEGDVDPVEWSALTAPYAGNFSDYRLSCCSAVTNDHGRSRRVNGAVELAEGSTVPNEAAKFHAASMGMSGSG